MEKENSRLRKIFLSSPAAKHCGKAAVLFLTYLLTVGLSAQDFSQAGTKPEPSAALIQQVNDALAAGDYSAALKTLTTLNTQTPNNPQILYNLGLTTEALNDATATASPPPTASTLPTAETYYRRSIAANPLFPPPHAALGLLLARTNHLPEARTELLLVTTFADADPALKARADRALARINLDANSPQAASEDLLAALRITPETPGDILLSAEIAEAIPDLPTAEQAYRRSLALAENVGNPEITASLAHILLAEHRPAEAETLLLPALATHPADPTLTAQLSSAYLASGDDAKISKAAPLLEALHAKNPADANITRVLARVYVETGSPGQADPLYAALTTAQSQTGKAPDPTLLADHAQALLLLHRPGEAETLLKQAIANPTGFPNPQALGDAATHLAFAAMEIDDPKVALQALTLRSTVQPPSPSTLFLEATADDTLHQSVKAVDLYKQFLAAAHGNFPEQESQARERLAILGHRK